MQTKNKVIIIGPPATGKTTITNVFFKKANPLRLLNKPLEPTRGVNSNLFSLFNSQLGIFDLAGQENENWFTHRKDVFKYADIIICVFDITCSVESIVPFLINILNIKKNLNFISDCEIYVLIHKIDLVNPSYISQKIKIIENFFTKQYPTGQKIKIFGTSITKDYFYDTFKIIFNILKSSLEMDIIPISNSDFQDLKTELEILLYFDPLEVMKTEKLESELDLSKEDLLFHLRRLKKLGFIDILSETNKVKSTKRSEFFREKLKQEVSKVGLTKENKGVKLIHMIMELNPISA